MQNAGAIHRAHPPRRSHAERSAETRERLLQATLAVVADGGLRGASMFEVAKAAGVTPGAVQHHFGTKAELMAQVVERLVSDQDGTAVPWPSPTMPLRRRAHAYVDALWTALYAPERFLVAWSVYFGALDDAELRARIGTQRKGVVAVMRRRFRETFPEANGPDLDAFIDLVLSSLRGLGVSRLFDRGTRAHTAQRAALADLIEARCAGPLAVSNRSRRARTAAPAPTTRRPHA